MSDVFCEKRVAVRLGSGHVDCLEPLCIFVRDPQVVLGDRGDVVCLGGGGVGLPRLRLVVTVGHEISLSTAKTQIQADISTSMF